MTPVEQVRRIYAAFLHGDVPTILSVLAQDVVWEYGIAASPIPWLERRNGRNAVAGFFEDLKLVDIVRFEPSALLADEDLVVALFDVELIVKATGKRVVEIDEVHNWRFNKEGVVKSFRHQVYIWTLAQALVA
jgi:ketosteroid isomerase-like protein